MTPPTHIVTVLTPDRPGIVHALAGTLAREGVRHLAISQTVVHGAFTIALVLVVPAAVDAASLRDALARSAGERASASLLALEGAPTPASGVADRYVLTALGRAGSGTVGDLARIVLEHGGNFTDFSTENVDGSVQLIAEVELPGSAELAGLQAALAATVDRSADGGRAGIGGGSGRELTVRLQHQRLFAATNEVAFRRVRRGGRP